MQPALGELKHRFDSLLWLSRPQRGVPVAPVPTHRDTKCMRDSGLPRCGGRAGGSGSRSLLRSGTAQWILCPPSGLNRVEIVDSSVAGVARRMTSSPCLTHLANRVGNWPSAADNAHNLRSCILRPRVGARELRSGVVRAVPRRQGRTANPVRLRDLGTCDEWLICHSFKTGRAFRFDHV
jgi:hypothetical protein